MTPWLAGIAMTKAYFKLGEAGLSFGLHAFPHEGAGQLYLHRLS